MAKKTLAANRKAFHRFEILETLEAGVVLTGSETKSAKAGHVTLSDAYAIIKADECLLLNCHISPYSFDSFGLRSANPTRTRKLLLHKKEISRLIGKITAKGLTLIPLEFYTNERGLVKLTLALAKGKKGPDRREEIKKRDIERELRRDYKLR